MTTTTTTTSTTGAPAPLNPRAIALAHYASRALLEGVLARHGLTFEQSVVLRAVTAAGGRIERDALVIDVNGSLKAGEGAVRAVLDRTVRAGLLETDAEQPALIRLTDAGRELFERTGAETAPITARVYAGIPAEDLAVAGRVLALVAERANAELARAS
ncbi:MarR family transcriptional regulator [Kitasatospora sp. NPDC001539]|uniref:MarR family transcriptional regulator n=1 Tax=Kitasatospora sp. NPDC001539 TaxID=3154384 RepID=UPI0033192505